MKRRKFILNNSLALGGLALHPINFAAIKHSNQENKFISKRPPIGERTFISKEVEKTIKRVKSSITDKELAWMFENCYPNTLDTTVDYEVINGKPDTFVITGDIDAMWLRDSTAQVWPYMPLIKKRRNSKI